MKNLINQSQNSYKNIWGQSPYDIVLMLGIINYTEIFFINGKKMIVATTLKKLEKRYEMSGVFFRTHKKYLVNLQHIKDYQNLVTDEYIEMQTNHKVIVSRRRKLAFIEKLENSKLFKIN